MTAMRSARVLLLLICVAAPVRAQEPPAGQRVYLCGHSFHMMTAAPLDEIARSAGIKDHVQVGKSGLGGSSVLQHWEVADDSNQVKAALRSGKVDVLTVAPNGRFFPDDGIARFTVLLLEHNARGRVLVQASWAPMDGQRSKTFKNGDRDAADPKQVRKNAAPIMAKFAENVRDLNKVHRDKSGRQVVQIVPVGEAVYTLRERVAEGKAPGVAKQSELFRDDLGHPNAHIAVLSGYCHYAVIYGRSPVGLPVPPLLKKAGLGETTEPFNRVLQEAAWHAVTTEPLSGVRQ